MGANGSDGMKMNNQEQNYFNINRDIDRNERGRRNLSNHYYMKNMGTTGDEENGKR